MGLIRKFDGALPAALTTDCKFSTPSLKYFEYGSAAQFFSTFDRLIHSLPQMVRPNHDLSACCSGPPEGQTSDGLYTSVPVQWNGLSSSGGLANAREELFSCSK